MNGPWNSQTLKITCLTYKVIETLEVVSETLTNLHENLTTDRSHNAEHFLPLCHNFAKPNGFTDICEKLPSDPYVLFQITAAVYFGGSKIPTKYPKEHSY